MNDAGMASQEIDAARAALARDGFALVPGLLGERALDELREAIAAVVAFDGSDDLLRAPDGQVRTLTYPLDKHPVFLRHLGDPGLVSLALGLSPNPAEMVLTWEDILLKPAFTGLAVPAHQDIALQSVHGGVFSLGIHLDDADDNPLRFLPGTQSLGALTRDQVRRLAAERTFVSVRPRAGDVLVHDVLVVHESLANTGPRPRTTWYLEFRTLEMLRRDGPWSTTWVAKRRRLLFLAAARRQAEGLPALWPPLCGDETHEALVAGQPELRVPHVGGGIGYDLSSPYYHFD